MTLGIVAASLDILGGQGVEAALLIRSLEADGHTVTFVPINPRSPSFIRWVKRVRMLRTAVNQIRYLPSLLRLRGVDVVHVFSASYWSFLLAPVPAMLAARAFGKRVILHYHSGEAEHHLARWGWLVHPWLTLPDAIVVPSRYLSDVFSRHGYDATVIPNIVDLSAFEFRERRPLGPHLLSTRNLEPYYDVETVLLSYALLKADVPSATLTIAGTGSQEARLRRLASGLSLDGLRFVGRVEPEDMPRLCSEADIFLNASVLDNQPVSVLEAWASGLAIVSTPTGALREMLRHGENALVVPQRNPAAMAKAVMSLLVDPDRALAMTHCARSEVSRYSWPQVRRAWETAYQGI
jgi:glycosyltransferase involved in cell wall biosynthesis